MRQIRVVVLGVVVILLGSCNNRHDIQPYIGEFDNGEFDNSKFNNPQQKIFDDFLRQKKDFSSCSNDIQKKEYIKKIEADLSNFLDTVKVFVNWKGKINNIEASEFFGLIKIAGWTNITFEISYEPEEYRKVCFKCSHIVETDKLNEDYIYNQVKNISNSSTVYFDGFINRDFDGKVVYYGYKSDDLQISYPEYKFNILKINTKPVDTLSTELKNMIDANFKIMDLAKQKHQKEITEKEFKARLKELKTLQPELSEKEKEYGHQMLQYLFLNTFGWDLGLRYYKEIMNK